jgi:hypothetical protein
VPNQVRDLHCEKVLQPLPVVHTFAVTESEKSRHKQNARHHGLRVAGIDPFSSGPWFDGWSRKIAVAFRFPGATAKIWLLRIGWRRHGLIGIDEAPRSASP